jgi:hypothetical protein
MVDSHTTSEVGMKPHLICHMVARVDGRALSSQRRPRGVGA